VLDALFVSLKVLAMAVPILVVLGGGLGWVLARCNFPGREFLAIGIQLLVVLPPSVVGFYLLSLLAGLPVLKEAGILFSFPAVVLGAVTPSLPIMVQSARAAFKSVDRTLEEAAMVLGAPFHRVFLTVTLPLARRTLAAGLAMASARALGDFGVTLMVAGNMPGVTQTLPLFIYSRVESLDFQGAHVASALLVMVGISCLWAIRVLEDNHAELR